MENIIGLMRDKYRNSSATRSLEHFREVLNQEELDEFDAKRFNSKQEFEDYLFLNIVSRAYQDGISAGKKLSDKNGMNEIDAVEFTIKELKKLKDTLKVKVADKLSDNKTYKVVYREAYSTQETVIKEGLNLDEAQVLVETKNTEGINPNEYFEWIEEK